MVDVSTGDNKKNVFRVLAREV